ncbi:hypothetical protein [Acidiphilium angustum]|uniref:hypothetical protein n=1 Tax=Acidiphilium angustum TaxID=523 RepID=UPI00049466C8|nr:hypothetical protein [Acidiphilium angustum]
MPGVIPLSPDTTPLLFRVTSYPNPKQAFVEGRGPAWVVGQREMCGDVIDYLVAPPGSTVAEFVPTRVVTFADNLVAFPARAAVVSLPPCDTERPAC